MIPINQMVRAKDATHGTVIGRVYGHRRWVSPGATSETDDGHLVVAVEPLAVTGHRFCFPEEVLTPVERAWVPVQDGPWLPIEGNTQDIPLQFRKPICE